jgi:hypothetical protein
MLVLPSIWARVRQEELLEETADTVTLRCGKKFVLKMRKSDA